MKKSIHTPDAPPSVLLRSLLQSGLQSSLQLQRASGKSQASVSRALANSGTDVITLGKAQHTRYGLLHSIRGDSGQQPIFMTQADGSTQHWGSLAWLHGQWLHISCDAGEWTTQGNVPWFMQPLRPQGFLGRLRGQQMGYAESNPELWPLDTVLHSLLHGDRDPPGALTLGDRESAPHTLAPADSRARAAWYDTQAQSIGRSFPAGSSAGGEQAKFLAHIETDNPHEQQHVVVKFTPPRGTPFGERWHDLLHTEALAAQVLHAHGFAVAPTRVLHSARRTYLESVRFDRVGKYGKRHAVALSAAHAAFVTGPQQHWPASCAALAQLGLLSESDAQQAACLHSFGRLIGNTDMHFGNLSLLVEDLTALKKPQLRLAPSYDMLSMAWRPSEFRDEIGYTAFELPHPRLGEGAAWQQAVPMALDFWQRLSELQEVDAALRRVAAAQHQRLASADYF